MGFFRKYYYGHWAESTDAACRGVDSASSGSSSECNRDFYKLACAVDPYSTGIGTIS
jgi:hypothetical protein